MTIESVLESPASPASLRIRLNDAVRGQLLDEDRVRSISELFDDPSHAIVIDANRLRGEIRALAQGGVDTALVTLARIGFLRVFAAHHVLNEVERYLDKWANETGTDEIAYHDAWESVLRPLISEAAFSRNLLTPDEVVRIEHLEQPAPIGDPDDVPTAIAAMVLEAPLLSRDGKALAAVYGPGVDMAVHEAYLDALFGAGRVLVVSQWGQGALMLARVFGALGTSGLRGVVARTGWMPLLLGSGVLTIWGASSRRTRTWLAQAKDPLIALGNALLEVRAFYEDAEKDFERLALPLVPDVAALPHHVEAARRLARSSALERQNRCELD